MHNSEQVIENTISKWKKRLSTGTNEIILVENGSIDRTFDIAEKNAKDTKNIKFKLVRSEKGLGNAYSKGISVSTGKKILLTADDLPFEFDDLDEVDKLTFVTPIIIGSKAHKYSAVERGLLRKSFTRGYRFARFLLLGSRVGDTQGTFLVEGEWLRKVNHLIDEPGFLYTTQLAVYAEGTNVEITEVPVSLSRDHGPKESTVRWSDVFEMGSGLLRIRKFKKRINSRAGISINE